ncbi:hypothetical protein FB451DRAFT_1171937 [Mycena latifolia]|nr:hypothetical protein FB451DRAFT_1171937 [Mycena latifolia]
MPAITDQEMLVAIGFHHWLASAERCRRTAKDAVDANQDRDTYESARKIYVQSPRISPAHIPAEAPPPVSQASNVVHCLCVAPDPPQASFPRSAPAVRVVPSGAPSSGSAARGSALRERQYPVHAGDLQRVRQRFPARRRWLRRLKNTMNAAKKAMSTTPPSTPPRNPAMGGFFFSCIAGRTEDTTSATESSKLCHDLFRTPRPQRFVEIRQTRACYISRQKTAVRSSIVDVKFTMRSLWAAKKGTDGGALKQARNFNLARRPRGRDGQCNQTAEGLYCTMELEFSIVLLTSAARTQAQNEAVKVKMNRGDTISEHGTARERKRRKERRKRTGPVAYMAAVDWSTPIAGDHHLIVMGERTGLPVKAVPQS